MNQFTFVLICLSAFLMSTQVYAVAEGKVAGKTKVDEAALFEHFGVNSTEDFLALTPKEIRKRTGKRLKLTEVIALKVTQKKIRKSLKDGTGSAEGSKSQIAAVLLAFFVGIIGIHRFYLGYTTIGIIQILTLGGLGIWALIDFIRIITGDLKPADGSDYDPSF